MTCTRCGRLTEVRATRTTDGMIRRRRECTHCGHRFSTFEIDDGLLKTIQKHMAPHREAIAKRVALTRRNEEIVARLNAGEKHSVVAAEFGLSDNMISTIARRAGIPAYRNQRRGASNELLQR